MTNIIPIKPKEIDEAQLLIATQLYGISLQLNTLSQYMLNTGKPDLSDILFHVCRKIETVGDAIKEGADK